MLGVIKIATVAAFVQIVEGHVRALPTAAGFGCRNCNGKVSPGQFSVAGPLGGNRAFGSNGVNTVTEGQDIELKIAYNGGHKSATMNFFNVRYACGTAANNQATFNRAGPTDKATINCSPPCKQLKYTDITTVDGAAATATNYPVDATASRRDGYTVKFKAPKIDGTGDARKCTFALVEGRNWGAGWDFDVKTAGAPAPPTTPKPPAKSVQGTYVFNAGGCRKDAPNCKCLTGSINVKHTAGAGTADAHVDIPGYPKQKFQLTQKIPGAWSVRYILANCATGDQELDIVLAPDTAAGSTASVLNVGIVSEIPTICGAIVKTSPTTVPFPAGTVTVQQQCPGCTDTAGWSDKDSLGCDQYGSCLDGKWRFKGLDHYKKYARSATGPTARDACCRCGGGSTKLAVVAPTAAPPATVTPPKADTPKPNPGGPVLDPTRPGTLPKGEVTTRRKGGGIAGPAAIEDSAQGVGITFGAVMTVFAGMFM